MNEDWWPDLLRHVPEEDPWAESNVVVGEIRSFDDPWLPGVRWTWSALVPTSEWEALNGELIAFNHEVESTGRPMRRPDLVGSVRPRFWIGAYTGERRLEFEPLILSWENNNRTPLILDPKFAMTYGLVPRTQGDGTVRWDNPAEPEYDVAIIDPPSLYEDLRSTNARAVVSKDYLQDYLTLRGMELVQVYYESRHGERDDAIDGLLGAERQISRKQRTRELDVRRRECGGFFAQVWGARHVAGPGSLPVTDNPLETTGLVWPGSDEAVTIEVSQRKRPWDNVYVEDRVLAAYEGKPDFRVGAENGSVGFGNQWAVGPAKRIGRDVIQLELRKLYEGTPHRVVQHWNAFAIKPSPDLLSLKSRRARNVGLRAKDLVFGMADVGLMLCGIAAMFRLEPVGTAEYVGLDRAWLEPNGWWSGSHVEPITHHIPVDMPRADFLARCLDLDKLLVEALVQRRLRSLLRAFGKPHDRVDDFRGLKLLDRIVCLCQVAIDAGLIPWEAGDEIAERYERTGSEPARPLTRLFALSDLRQAAGHRSADIDGSIAAALERFGIDVAMSRGGYGLVLDTVYDQLHEQLRQIHATLAGTLKIEATR